MQTAVQAERGWQARLELGYEARGDKTRLVHRSMRGPLAVQRPFYPQAGICHSYLLHPPGGVVGGDELEIDVRVADGAHALITTPGATKFYRCAGLTAHQTQHFRVENGGILEWLPQENIFFPGASSRLRSRIDVAAGGRFIGWELQCLGRPANNEAFGFGAVDSRCEIHLDGRRILIDQLQVEGQDQFGAAAGMRGHAMAASLYALPANEAMLQQVQSLIDERFADSAIGATLLDSVLAVRMLGQNTEDIQAVLVPVWEMLRQALLGLEPCPPRIWST
ncbi:urease accessory protein UreD [Marinobacterium rhizophilum]|uniref:urease accessory protein UreD n=1 Tax=Marinobacterium rhizophilum TaxID=420402 RepID=UPI00036AA871|nr:urease accessory protein UreD [Marinobacterium rhizophilum]